MVADRYAEIFARHRWQVPPDFNIAHACCGRYADDRGRFALYWEDESGARAAFTYWDLQQRANRLANAWRNLGVEPGDKIAIILPQRPETVIAHIACYQSGLIAVPLSFLFGPDALQYRLDDSRSVVALVDPASWANLQSVRQELTGLSHVIGVAGACGPGMHDYEALLAQSSPRFTPIPSQSTDPALLIYTSGTTGPSKGALMPQQCLLGNLPGFIHSHDFFPKAGDMFWSPADWAWTGGLMDALLPSLYFRVPILGYRGRFEPERAFDLIERYQIRNAFLFPTALKMMMKAVPSPKERYDLHLRSIMSGGEPVGTTVLTWAREALGVTINEIFGQTEINYIVGNSHTAWPVKSGSMGRPYPGHRIALIDESGAIVPDGEIGEVAVHRIAPDGAADPVFFLGYHNNPDGTVAKFSGDWCRTGDLATQDSEGYLWYQGRTDDMFKAAGYRIGPAEIENCLLKHPAVANAAVVGSPDETRGNIVKAFVVLAAGHRACADLEEELALHVRQYLAPYEYPKEIEFIAELPMTTTGKIQRRVLRLREIERKKA